MLETQQQPIPHRHKYNQVPSNSMFHEYPVTYYWPPLEVFFSPQPASLLGHAPSLSLLLIGSCYFEPNLHLYKHPSSLIPVILPPYTTNEDGTGTVFQNVCT
jgi:hypothetical protein